MKGSIKDLTFVGIIVAITIVFCSCSGELASVHTNDDSSFVSQSMENKEESKKESAPEMTMGQKNALKKAKSYLDIMAFSKRALVKQLEFEGYESVDATFAVENCGADWMEQAAKKAKSYLEMMAFSKDGLIKQLEFEGFSSEEASYGATANGY